MSARPRSDGKAQRVETSKQSRPDDLGPRPAEQSGALADVDSELLEQMIATERQPHFRTEMSVKAGGMYTRTQVAEFLGVNPGTVDRRRRRRQLLGVPDGTQTCYPAAQFKDGQAVPGLQPILKAFGDMDAWGQLQLLVAPIEGFSERPRSILDLLAHGMEEATHRRLISLVRGWSK